MIRLTVVIASGKLVQTWIEKPFFPIFLGLNQKGRKLETKTLCKHWETGKIPTQSLNGKLKLTVRGQKNWLSKKYMNLRQTWRSNTGKRGIQIWLFVRSVRSSSLNDFSHNKRIDGQIRLKEVESACMENCNWEMDSSKKIMQAKDCPNKLKNWGEFVAKKQIEQDKQELMNCRCIKRGNQGAALERPTFPVNAQPLRVPGPCPAAILDYCTIHGILRILQETFLNDHALKKEDPLLSSTIQRISHPLLRNWDLTLQELQRERRVKWKENRSIRQSLTTLPKCWIILVELILSVVWLIIRDFRFRNCIWEHFLTLWSFKAGKSTSRLKFVRKQHIVISQCTGSKKLRSQSQVTI